MGNLARQKSSDNQTSSDVEADHPNTSSGADNSMVQQRIGSGGGQEYVIVRGDTLWSISEQTYGHGRHWRQIMQANPNQVFRGGDLILVGGVLSLPTIETEEENVETTGETVDGGVCEAVEVREICTEYGNFRIYPDGYAGDMVAEEGVEAVTESEYVEIVAEREAAANAQREQTESEVEELLTTGLLDWAITDAEALEAFLAQARSSLDGVTRNVSARAKPGPCEDVRSGGENPEIQADPKSATQGVTKTTNE